MENKSISTMSMQQYKQIDSVDFMRSVDFYGLFSNMTMNGGNVFVCGQKARSTENVFQALKFPHDIILQKEILFACDSMSSKALARKYESQKRKDWNNISFTAMRYCIALKIAQIPKIIPLLLETKNKYIVEKSYKDSFWGAKPVDDMFVGCNFLGRIWMEARQRLVEIFKEQQIPQDFTWTLYNQEKLILLDTAMEDIVIPSAFFAQKPQQASLLQKPRM